jgi:hypothetical protein
LQQSYDDEGCSLGNVGVEQFDAFVTQIPKTIWHDATWPTCLTGSTPNYRPWPLVGIDMDPVLNTVAIAIPTYTGNIGLGNYGFGINLIQTEPFNMDFVLHSQQGIQDLLVNQSCALGPPCNHEVNQLMPQLQFTKDNANNVKFGMTFLSNSDNIDFSGPTGGGPLGGMRVIGSVGPFLPNPLPAALGGKPTLPYFVDDSTLVAFHNFGQYTGLDAPTCGNYEAFWSDPHGPIYKVGFTP